MIALNLLPPQEKYLLAQGRLQRLLLFYGIAIMGALLIFMVLLGTIWLYVDLQYKTIANELNSVQASLNGLDLKTQGDEVTTLNAQLQKISSIQKNQNKYSELLPALANLVTDGIRLDSLSFDPGGKVALNGYAQKREQIIAFKDSLEKSGLFVNIENPLSNLVKETDINFVFNFQVGSGVLNK